MLWFGASIIITCLLSTKARKVLTPPCPTSASNLVILPCPYCHWSSTPCHQGRTKAFHTRYRLRKQSIPTPTKVRKCSRLFVLSGSVSMGRAVRSVTYVGCCG